MISPSDRPVAVAVVGLFVLLAAGFAFERPLADLLVRSGIGAGAVPAGPPSREPLDPAVLYGAYEAAAVSGPDDTLRLERVGRLVVPGGAIVATDPFALDEPPLDVEIGPGRYAVELVLARADGVEIIAAAVLRIADGRPAAWRTAVAGGTDGDATYVAENETGGFTTPEAIAVVAGPDKRPAYADAVIAELADRRPDGWDAAVVEVDPATGANVVAFQGGLTRAAYPSHWGLDSGGRPLVLVTDFLVLEAAG